MVAAGLDPEILHTRATTMRAFLDGVRQRYGSVANYARLAGIDEGCIETLRASLLEP
jgi:hypothetical protein